MHTVIGPANAGYSAVPLKCTNFSRIRHVMNTNELGHSYSTEPHAICLFDSVAVVCLFVCLSVCLLVGHCWPLLGDCDCGR